ncbi:hypothetical protein RB597_003040 [Gaeumannomyces tritici]
MSSKMEYVRLGNSGLKVSRLIQGCMAFGSPAWEGSPWTLGEDEGLGLLKKAYDLGINTWDTADTYSNGASEATVGKALRQFAIPRSRPAANDGALVNQMGLSRKHVFKAVDDSLARLGTDYIDVLQIHRLDRETPPEEIMEALHDVVRSGKVRYLGASSMYAWEFARLQHVADKNGWTKKGDGGGGAAPTLREQTDVKSRRWNETANPAIVDRVEELAKKKGVSMAVLATAWVLHKGCAPILGLSTEERIEEAVQALSVKLTEEELRYLEEEYKPREVQGM